MLYYLVYIFNMAGMVSFLKPSLIFVKVTYQVNSLETLL